MTTSDEEDVLLAGLCAKDPLAIERLYDSCGRRAFGLAYRLVGDYGAAEDIVQEAFLGLWQYADRIDPRRGRLISLLLTIVHHKAIDRLRQQREPAQVQNPCDPPDPANDPADLALQALDRSVVQDALSSLPAEQRRTVQLAYFGGYTHREIAAATEAPLGTVKSRLRIALLRLRLILREKVRA